MQAQPSASSPGYEADAGTHGRLSRRTLLHAGAVAGAGWALGASPSRRSVAAADDAPSFFVISDTHYLAQRDQPTKLTADSRDVNDRLIETLNGLPGQTLPAALGGGDVGEPRGVIHLGDVVDTGDKFGGVHEQMTDTEWKHYVEQFGLTGREGKLRFPIYEIHGNHDSPRQRNAPVEGIMRRNGDRPGLKNVSDNGLHYSWDCDRGV
jgi:hypothetical protein